MPLASEPSAFFDRHSPELNAIAILVATAIVAKTVDMLVTRNARRVTSRLPADQLSQATVTRLRLVRRLLTLTIVVIGASFALAQIDALRGLAATLLASSAVAGVALGFAARGVLANAIAGLMLATVQPFRIGDVIEWNGNRGRVDDITLSYTFVRLPSGHRLVVPNESIATTPLENYTIAGGQIEAGASVWVRPARAAPALKLLRERVGDANVQVGECQSDRIELVLEFKTTAEQEAARRDVVREQAVAALAGAGMLDFAPESG